MYRRPSFLADCGAALRAHGREHLLAEEPYVARGSTARLTENMSRRTPAAAR